jgi:hypothetical protein
MYRVDAYGNAPEPLAGDDSRLAQNVEQIGSPHQSEAIPDVTARNGLEDMFSAIATASLASQAPANMT